MSIGWQEIIALGFVALVLGAALYRRWKKSRTNSAGCSDCDSAPEPPQQATIRFYRRRR